MRQRLFGTAAICDLTIYPAPPENSIVQQVRYYYYSLSQAALQTLERKTLSRFSPAVR